MPISNPMDDNIFQSAEWTRPSPPGHRYQMLGGVQFFKQQNPTYIDETNRSLSTRAIDRRVANPPDSMFEVTPSPDEAQEGASAKAGSAPVTKETKGHRRRRRRNQSRCRAEDTDDQETFTVCPDRPTFSQFFGDFASEMGGTCKDLSLALSSRGQSNKPVIDRITDAVYQRKRPFYIGIVLLLLLLIIIAVIASATGNTCKKTSN